MVQSGVPSANHQQSRLGSTYDTGGGKVRNDHSRFDTNWKALLLAETFVDFHKYTEAGKPAPM